MSTERPAPAGVPDELQGFVALLVDLLVAQVLREVAAPPANDEHEAAA